MKIYIRKGKVEDLPSVLNLIRELADYERSPDEVEVSIQEMENWGFGKEKVFDFFVAEVDAQILGIALYYFKYSTWKGKCIFLEDIIVHAPYRGKGIGKQLFQKVVGIAKEEKVRRLEWQVLNWNHSALEFYKNMGSEFDNEWINCKLPEKEIIRFSEDMGK